MSLFNLPLSHVSIKRTSVSKWAEEEAKNCPSMKDISSVETKAKERNIEMLSMISKYTKKT